MLKLVVVATLFLVSFSSWAQLKFAGVSTSEDFMCVHTDSKVYCWGARFQELDGFSHIRKIESSLDFGCLSDDLGLACFGDYPSITPEMISGDISDFRVNKTDVCVLLQGELVCTGIALANMPTDLKNVSFFDMNEKGMCAIQKGKLYCWGDLSEVGTIPNNLGEVVKVSLNKNWGCVLNSKNNVICWYGNYGRPALLNVPTNVGQITDIQTDVYHGCLTTSDGRIHCWGESTVNFPADFRAVQISTQNSTTCGVDVGGDFKCSGWKSGAYKLPPILTKPPGLFAATSTGVCFVEDNKVSCSGASSKYKSIPASKVTYLSAAYNNICFIDEMGPRCFDDVGQRISSIPNDLDSIGKIFIGENTACGTIEEGKLRCWGDGGGGMANPPRGLKNVKKVVFEKYAACALTEAGKVVCWGNSQYYKQHSETYLDISSGYKHYCLLKENDIIECVGADFTPMPTHLMGVKHLISGDSYSCAATETEVACWGSRYGNLPILNPAPKVVGKIKSIVGGEGHACFQDDEKIKCWGRNTSGEYIFFQNELKD